MNGQTPRPSASRNQLIPVFGREKKKERKGEEHDSLIPSTPLSRNIRTIVSNLPVHH